MSHCRGISYLLHHAEFTRDLFLPDAGVSLCLLSWAISPSDLTGTEAFLRTLGFQCKTGSVSGKLLTHFLRGVLALLSGLLQPGDQHTNQRLHFSERASLLSGCGAQVCPATSYFRCLPESIPDRLSPLPKLPLKVLAVTTDI